MKPTLSLKKQPTPQRPAFPPQPPPPTTWQDEPRVSKSPSVRRKQYRQTVRKLADPVIQADSEKLDFFERQLAALIKVGILEEDPFKIRPNRQPRAQQQPGTKRSPGRPPTPHVRRTKGKPSTKPIGSKPTQPVVVRHKRRTLAPDAPIKRTK